MTTPAAAVYNPNNVDVATLPIIYGFNNGGVYGYLNAQLIAADGTSLGGHVCSNEGYMPYDLGIVEGSRPDRHETFKTHYPNGYRMVFVSYTDVPTHTGLQMAFELYKQKQEK